MNIRTRHSWQLALLASCVTAGVGGSMHPEADADGSVREELAAMTAHADWVPGHALLSLSVALLVVGLWGARRSRRWPRADRALGVATVVVGLYFVESLAHLGAVLDSDALAAGGTAPVATAHLAMAAVLYPVTGACLVWLALVLGREWGRLGVLALPGVLGGLAHAVSAPAALLFPDFEASWLFAAAGMLIALWALVVGAMGLTRPARRVAAGTVAPGDVASRSRGASDVPASR